MFNSFLCWSIVLVVLVIYLCLSVSIRHWRAARDRTSGLLGTEASPFDPLPIADRLHQVREDYLACVRHRSRLTCPRQNRLAKAREHVAELNYFREHTTAEQGHTICTFEI